MGSTRIRSNLTRYATIRIIVGHPKEILRHGLLSVFEKQTSIKVVGQGSSAKDLAELVKQHDPNILLWIYHHLLAVYPR